MSRKTNTPTSPPPSRLNVNNDSGRGLPTTNTQTPMPAVKPPKASKSQAEKK